METAFTRLVGGRAPVQLAPMPGVGTPELVAAVPEARGLGMFTAALRGRERLAADLDALAARCRAPFGVNFLVPFLDRVLPAAAIVEEIVAGATRAPRSLAS